MLDIRNHRGGMAVINQRRSTGHSTITTLPRLSYLGEVPVECSYHGSALLWRLFENYPPEDLLIVEGIHRSSVERRLPRVQYIHPPTPGVSRMLRTRYAIQVSEILYRTIPILTAVVLPSVAYRRPEAIITVCHGLFWLVAAKVANMLKVPLHLIVHDHVPDTVWGSERLRDRISDEFGRIYATAATRFCVSEEMVNEYERMFGVAGQVLYPSRARSPLDQSLRVVRCSIASGSLTGVFAGTVTGPECADALAALARQLARVGGRLVIYGLFSRAEAASCGLDLPNVEFAGLVPARVLRERCQKEADFLYVPMKFGVASVNARISFPSKLADYTEMGLPLLIRGPEYCSAVQWARKHPGVAQVVGAEDEGELLEAIKRLSNPDTRRTLAEEALRIGELYFSHSRAESTLFNALTRSAA